MKLKMRSITWLLSISIVASGSVFAGVSDSEAKNCRLVGEVQGSSGYGKHPAWQRLARHDALKKAESLDADRVVWGEPKSRGAFNGEVAAMIYACK